MATSHLQMDDVSIHFLIQETEMEIEKLQKNVCDVHGPFKWELCIL